MQILILQLISFDTPGYQNVKDFYEKPVVRERSLPRVSLQADIPNHDF